jgi:Family of unknown function (DUF6335)
MKVTRAKRARAHTAGRSVTKKRSAGKKGSGRTKERPTAEVENRGAAGELLRLVEERPETGPALSGGDIDADWQRGQSSGEETVGGSVATPDQDVVDEIGRALGVEQAPDAPVRASVDILSARDRDYWRQERRAAQEDV